MSAIPVLYRRGVAIVEMEFAVPRAEYRTVREIESYELRAFHTSIPHEPMRPHELSWSAEYVSRRIFIKAWKNARQRMQSRRRRIDRETIRRAG